MAHLICCGPLNQPGGLPKAKVQLDVHALAQGISKADLWQFMQIGGPLKGVL